MTQVWAHRGASGYAPENTVPAMELALEQGAHGIEIDVQLTRDDHVVVIHDETLERTTDGHGWVADHSMEDLACLDASAGHEKFAGTRIPELAQVLELIRGTDAVLNIELKNSRMPYKGLEELVVRLVAEHQVADQVVLSSFNHYSLRHLQRLRSELPLAALYSEPLWKPWQYALKLGADAIHPSLAATRRKVVTHCQERGLKVNVWTVNEPEDLRRMGALGVDAVITNYPNLAVGLLA